MFKLASFAIGLFCVVGRAGIVSAQSHYPDANSDDRVDLVDGNVLAMNFGTILTVGGPQQGDFNFSGTCDSVDLNIYASYYGSRRNGAPPPPQTTFEVYAGLTPITDWQLVPVNITPQAIASNSRLANAKCYDLKVSADSPVTAGGLNIVLTSGTFYNHPSGRVWRPSDAEVAGTPAIAFDTYVGSPLRSGVYGSFTMVIGKHPAVPANYVQSDTVLSAAWLEFRSENSGTFPIARLTILDSIQPPSIPEPGMAAILACSLVLSRRSIRTE